VAPAPGGRAVLPDSRARELRALLPFLLAALGTWGAGLAVGRLTARDSAAELAPWQRSYLELPAAGQRLYRLVREGILEAENVRSATKQWPSVEALAADGVPPFAADAVTEPLAWVQRRQGVYVNYLGVPTGGAVERWLVLFIEPEPVAFATPGEKPPPVDEEHHTLPDGTALHVTVWTQPGTGPAPTGVLAFPVTEGWTQRLGR
jgi:hypothetical protein